jgi:ornithine cyclodeaminase
MILLDHTAVTELLPMPECIDLMSNTLAALARGEATLPLRTVLPLPAAGAAFGMMPAALHNENVLGVKAITVFPQNRGTQWESHQGVVLLFELEHGSLLAIADASTITAIRTAAVSGVATRLLSREDAANLAILGSGVQAETHLDAMRAVRPLRRVRVWSRTAESARAFADRAAERYQLDVQPTATAREAVVDADIICTVTASREPVLEGAWISEGAHVNAVGSSVKTSRELDEHAVVRSSFFVDRRESTLAESGDFLAPLQQGLVTEAHIKAELGEVIVGQAQGRTSRNEVTLFKSLGLAVEDVAVANYLFHKAAAEKKGVHIELGGLREEPS